MHRNKTLTVYDNIPLGIAILDSELQVQTWNSTLSRWSCVNSEDAIGCFLGEILPEARVKQIKRRLDAVFCHGQSVVFSPSLNRAILPLKTSSGEPLIHKATFSPCSDGSKCTQLVIEDVTSSFRQLNKLRTERKLLHESEKSLKIERKRLVSKNRSIIEAQQKAVKANKAKSEFLASMSHEIRTPITAIKGFAEILADRLNDEELREAADTIVRNGKHLTDLVNDILDLSKIEADGLLLTYECCETLNPLKQTISLLAEKASKKNIELRYELHEGYPEKIFTDSLRLRQILFNLIGNAIKFTEEGSVVIHVRRSKKQGFIEIGVTDTGIGIHEENLKMIFDPFTQEDGSMQRRFGGTGLGLSISHKLVTMMKGSIQVKSVFGEGTTFTLELPIGSEEELSGYENDEVHIPSPKKPQQEKPLADLNILVAEDGPDNQKLIRYLLERAGAKTHFCDNGAIANEYLMNEAEGWSTDLLLLDMQMPVMDGYTTAQTIRSRGSKLPIIALTAHAMDGDREKALRAGCNDYATKPINPSQLIGQILELITLHSEPSSELEAVQ